MPVVHMDAKDFAAYSAYLSLPVQVRWTVRALLYLSRSDQRLVQQFVRILSRGSSGDGTPVRALRRRGRTPRLWPRALPTRRQSNHPAA